MLRYDFGPLHPLKPRRLQTGLGLIRALDALASSELLVPRAATEDELHLVHSTEYVSAIRALSEVGDDAWTSAGRFGLGPGDNPAFPGMHLAASLVAGASLEAGIAIMGGDYNHAFNPGGGLHHAMRDRASGFCIYNDPAVAIGGILARHDAKVLYLDFDCHHGDGVQMLFYDEPRVMTVSFHESGRYLFPGTGLIDELGEGVAKGTSVNLPVAPNTEDSSWLEAVELLVPALAERFRPDVIVSQHGCDTHAWDPLTHLALTTRAYERQARLVHELAHAYCGGRWLATGGGGYDLYRVVPRSWSLVWLTMSGRTLPEAMPESYRREWGAEAPRAVPALLLDQPEDFPSSDRTALIEQVNRATLDQLLGQLQLTR